MVARVTGEDTQLAEAEGLAKAVLSLPAVFPWYANMARAALGLVAVQRGDIGAAQEQYAALESLPSILVHYISSDRVLGILAETMGQFGQADAHFRDALTFCEKAGFRPEWAWSAYEYAKCLTEHNGPGNCLRAISLVDQTLTIITELDLDPLRDRVLALQQEMA